MDRYFTFLYMLGEGEGVLGSRLFIVTIWLSLTVWPQYAMEVHSIHYVGPTITPLCGDPDPHLTQCSLGPTIGHNKRHLDLSNYFVRSIPVTDRQTFEHRPGHGNMCTNSGITTFGGDAANKKIIETRGQLVVTESRGKICGKA